jgi:hypothetical protein
MFEAENFSDHPRNVTIFAVTNSLALNFRTEFK